ncbi:GntR family transcriptional regulator [Nonomuraea typhae]|uniref:GntR family transcriptional regulator n=1 Tax=Nonomuraea typhae TaxID=2603600 RepID=A0ABW7YSR7_9ACTN
MDDGKGDPTMHADGRPRHQQIAADLRAQIMSGRLEAGAQLPSTPQLVAQYSSANATIQRALAILKAEGYLYGRAGKGVYVRDRQPFVVDVAAYFTPGQSGLSYRLLDVSELRPPADIVRDLELEADETAIVRKRLLIRDDEPVELCWSYYPASIAAGSDLTSHRRIRGGAPRVLADLGLPEREFTDAISVRPPTVEEVEALHLPAEVPVICQSRVVYSDDRRPVEASILVKGGHLYELRYWQTITPMGE